MKKIFVFVLVIAMLFTLSACGVNDANLTGSTIDNNQNDITKAFNEGYESIMSSVEDNVFKAILQKDGGYEDVLLVVGEMTDEQYEEYNNLDWLEEEDLEKIKAILDTMTNVKSKVIFDLVPSQEELDSYIGKSIAELEDLGFENSGYIDSEINHTYFYDGPLYSINVVVDKGDITKEYDDLTREDFEKIVIESVEFQSFSFGILDNYQDYI